MANKVANAVTVGGLASSLLLLVTPMAPLTPLAVATFIVARIRRKMEDDQIEREERKNYNYNPRRSEAMSNNLPVLSSWNIRNELPSYGLCNTFPIVTTRPETELARSFPERAAKVLERQSLFQTSVDLANSSSVTEFARQHRGSRVKITHRTGFLGLKVDEMEFSIRPN